MVETAPTRHRATTGRTAGPLTLMLRGLSLVQRSPKPIHARGVVSTATLERFGSDPRSGVRWLDETGAGPVLVRRSRGAGFPPPLPDVQGLTIRVSIEDGHADILLGTTGLGRLTRFVPVPTTRSDRRPFTTLMPHRGPRGPVLLGARPRGAGAYDLIWASHRSGWTTFGRLTLEPGPSADGLVTFDPLSTRFLASITTGGPAVCASGSTVPPVTRAAVAMQHGRGPPTHRTRHE